MGRAREILVGWLLDGSGGPVREKVLLRVEGGRITAIRPAAEALSGSDPGRWTDLSHCTVLPPLVDCHLHLGMSGSTDRRVRERAQALGYEEIRTMMRRHLDDLFAHGVLAARDAGDRHGFSLRLREEGGGHPAVTLRLAGRAWHARGRYGALIGGPPDEEGLVEACLRQAGAVDQIKLVNSGLNSLEHFARETPPQFAQAEIAALVRGAAAAGLKVMVHANGRRPVREAILAGADSIEHGFFMGRDNLELLAERGVVWVPTAVTMQAYAATPEAASGKADPAVVEKNLQHQLAQLAQARQLGVTVALGSDAGSPGVLHGEGLIEEMKLLRRAGYSLTETVRCATANGARLLGLAESGTLTVGCRATFLVARGGPAQLPRKLAYLEQIYIDGRPSELYRKNPQKFPQQVLGQQYAG